VSVSRIALCCMLLTLPVSGVAKSCADLETQAGEHDSIELCKRSGPSPTACPRSESVLELIPQKKFDEIKKDFVNRCEWIRKTLCPRYPVKEVYRPHTDREGLVETNPHRRSGVMVCPGHLFEFYVMRNPLVSMPSIPLDKTAAELRSSPAFTSLQSMAVMCVDRERGRQSAAWDSLAAHARTMGQWPPEGARYLSGQPVRGFDAQPQTPTVLFACADNAKPPPPCGEPVCKASGPPVSPKTTQVVAAGLLGAGVAFAAARVWQRGGSSPAPGSSTSASVAASRRTRVRLDAGSTRSEG
jgi:hypothetical protein